MNFFRGATMVSKRVLLFIACITLCQLVGVAGSFITAPNIPGWYAALVKPGFTPPDQVFGTVWTILYILMGISLFLVIKDGASTREKKTAVAVFMAQLVLNFLWTPVFFALHALWAGFLIIIVLWALICVTMLLFWRVSRPAAYLLFPYLLWVGYASALNLAIAILN
jgi:tryptophan-rich sensory protein